MLAHSKLSFPPLSEKFFFLKFDIKKSFFRIGESSANWIKLTQVTVKTVMQKKAERWKCYNLQLKCVCACVCIPGPLVQCFKAKTSITCDERKAGGGWGEPETKCRAKVKRGQVE